MEDDSTSFNVTIPCKINKESVFPGLRIGLADGNNCIFREFESEREAKFFSLDCVSLGISGFVPHPKFRKGNIVCLDAPMKGIHEFFLEKQSKYFGCGKRKRKEWFPFIERDYRMIFRSAMVGMTALYQSGYAARNISAMSTIIFADSYHDLKVNFLDICPKGVQGALQLAIIQLRDLMKYLLSLSGHPYDHSSNRVSEDVLNFLANATDAYVWFMDPIWVLNDAFRWDVEEKTMSLLNVVTLLEDNPQKIGIEVYFDNYPSKYLDWIKPGSFVDKLLMRMRLKKSVPHGTLLGHEDSQEHEMCFSTLKARVAELDEKNNFLFSHIYWFICNLWFSGKVPDWQKHMFILGGLATWDHAATNVDGAVD